MRVSVRHYRRLSCFLTLSLVCLTGASASYASSTAHLSGSYEVEKVTLVGRDARVALKVVIVNGSDRDLSNTTVRLSNLLRSTSTQLLVSPLILRAHSTTAFSCEVTIPRIEYERWKRGARPVVSLQIPQPAGLKTTVLIRLAKGPASGGK